MSCRFESEKVFLSADDTPGSYVCPKVLLYLKRLVFSLTLSFLLFFAPGLANAKASEGEATPAGCQVISFTAFFRSLTSSLFPAATANASSSAALLVDTTRCRLILFWGTTPRASYPVATGKPETPTPVGSWQIKRKAMNWGNGFGTRWLGLDVPWGIYGIHGTNKPYTIGGYESAGCIRMFNADVEVLYPLVQPKTPVIIVGSILRGPRVLREGDCGSDVMEIQRLLRRHGYYHGQVDGNFGDETKQAVMRFRKAHRLPPDDCVDDPVYRLLGL